MKPVANPCDLTDTEAESVAKAVDIYRSSPTSLSSFHTVPIRDEIGKPCEVRFFADDEMKSPLAVIRVTDDGVVVPMEDLP